MSDTHAHHELEPFGQRSVRSLVRPLFITLCSVGIALSLSMLLRSHKFYDRFSRYDSYRRTDVTSAMGQVVIARRQTLRASDSGWRYESGEFASDNDGWPDSWMKVVGVQWGDEHFTRPDGRLIPAWRLRVRWRTALLLFAAPVVIDALLRRRRRDRGFPVDVTQRGEP